MGLCGQLSRKVLKCSVLTQKKKKWNGAKHHIEWIQPITDKAKVLKETDTLLFDMTQLFFFSNKIFTSMKNTEVQVYETLEEMLENKEHLVIGEIEITKENKIINKVQTFSVDDMVIALGNRIFDYIDNFKFAAKEHSAEDVLKYVFLCLDGDSPHAKTSTRKKRRKNGFKTSLKRKLMGISSSSNREDIINKLLQKTEAETVMPDKLFRGSMARFMTKRCNQLLVVQAMSEAIAAHKNPVVEDTSIYVVLGATRMTTKVTVFKLCGRFNHPYGERLMQRSLPPYHEADSLIPLVWSSVKTTKKGCVISKDSDMLLTLLALADEDLLLLYHMDNFSSLPNIFSNQVAFAVQPSAGIQRVKQVEMLLHLTVGGNDYVESFPKVGSETLMAGLDVMRTHPRHIFFPCISFVQWMEIRHLLMTSRMMMTTIEELEKPVCFDVQLLAESTVATEILRSALEDSSLDLYPIRLGTCVYLLAYDPNLTEETFQWYCKKCPDDFQKIPTAAQRKFMEEEATTMRVGFQKSMKRRLYSLSILTESRAPPCWIKLSDPELAHKNGYDAERDYEYEDAMFYHKGK